MNKSEIESLALIVSELRTHIISGDEAAKRICSEFAKVGEASKSFDSIVLFPAFYAELQDYLQEPNWMLMSKTNPRKEASDALTKRLNDSDEELRTAFRIYLDAIGEVPEDFLSDSKQVFESEEWKEALDAVSEDCECDLSWVLGTSVLLVPTN